MHSTYYNDNALTLILVSLMARQPSLWIEVYINVHDVGDVTLFILLQSLPQLLSGRVSMDVLSYHRYDLMAEYICRAVYDILATSSYSLY